MTSTSKTTQQLALIAVLILMIQSLAGIPQAQWASPTELIIDHLFGIALWCLFLWKLLRSPRKWSLSLCILFTCMLIFQCYLWHRGVTSHVLPENLFDPSLLHFALYEIPLVAAITLCFLLRRRLKADTVQPAPPPSS